MIFDKKSYQVKFLFFIPKEFGNYKNLPKKVLGEFFSFTTSGDT